MNDKCRILPLTKQFGHFSGEDCYQFLISRLAKNYDPNYLAHMIIHIINGPNLNLLGKRQPEIYGSRSFEAYFEELKQAFSGHELHYFQSNHEGYLIDKLHEVGFTRCGIVMNPGGFTHTSVALADAVAAIEAPVVEVHISNIHAREAFRRHSYVSPHCVGHFIGLGLDGYKMGIEFLLER